MTAFGPSEDEIRSMIYMGRGPGLKCNTDLSQHEAHRLAEVYCRIYGRGKYEDGRWRGRGDVALLLIVGFVIYRAVVSFL